MDYGHLLNASGPAPHDIIDNAALIYCHERDLKPSK